MILANQLQIELASHWSLLSKLWYGSRDLMGKTSLVTLKLFLIGLLHPVLAFAFVMFMFICNKKVNITKIGND